MRKTKRTGWKRKRFLSRRDKLVLVGVHLVLLLMLVLNHFPDLGSNNSSTPPLGQGFFSFFDGKNVLTGADVIETQNSGDGGTCGGLNETLTLLAANVQASGTCFTINASNIILDCAGYEINYSEDGSSVGFGINVTGFSNVTIQNCVIKEGHDNNNGKHGILIDANTSNASNHITLFNNTIITTGVQSSGIYIRSSNNTNASFNNITTSGEKAQGIYLYDSSHATFLKNNITTSGDSASGIETVGSEALANRNNTFTGDSIYAKGAGVALYMADMYSKNNTFINLTATSVNNYTILDLSTVESDNTLIYDGTYGKINWTKSNLTTNLSLEKDITIFLDNGTVGVLDNDIDMMALNDTAQIELKGLPYSSTPYLYKDGVRCDDGILCNLTFDTSTGVLMANVSSFSNYTVNGRPTQGTPVLNSTDPATNNSNQNLTAYNITPTDHDDEDKIRSIYNWLVNSSSIMVLNMPFEKINGSNSSNAWDYSGFGNNLSEFFDGGASWNSTGGHDGNGAYRFNGGDYLALNDTNGLNITGNFTIALWVYRITDSGSQEPLISLSNDTDVNIDLFISDSDQIEGVLTNDSGSTFSNATSGVSLDTWTHIAVNFNGSYIRTYVNGSIKGSTDNPSGFTIRGSPLPLRIGRSKTVDNFDGLIDDVRIYNRSLSPEQILAIFNNKTDLIVSQETTSGQNWTVDVTVNDGEGDGDTSRSNQLITTDLVGCGTIEADATMTRNLEIDGTCFTIGASGITLDCDNFEINYSSGGTYGNAIDNTGGYDDVIIKNCLIKEGTDATVGKTAINFSDSALNCSIVNNTIYTVGDESIAISVINSNNTGITENVISTSGDEGLGIRLLDWHHDNVSFNIVNVSGTDAEALYLEDVSNSSIIANRLKSYDGSTLFMLGYDTVNNTLWNNTILSTLYYSILDNSSSVRVNQLIYNSTYNIINWTLGNLTTMLNLSVKPVEDDDEATDTRNTIWLDNHALGLIDDNINMLQLNSTDTGRITLKFYNVTQDGYSLWRVGSGLLEECRHALATEGDPVIFCNYTKANSNDDDSPEDTTTVYVNVSSFSNYSVVPADEGGTPDVSGIVDFGSNPFGPGSQPTAAEIAAAEGISIGEAQAMIAAHHAAEAAGLIGDFASPDEIRAFFTVGIFGTSAEIVQFRQQLGEIFSPADLAQLQKDRALAGEAAQLGLAAEGGRETRSALVTGSISMALSNAGTKSIRIMPNINVEDLAPRLANQENAERRIRESVITRTAERGLDLSAEGIEAKVQEETLYLQLVENENVRQMVGRTLGLSQLLVSQDDSSSSLSSKIISFSRSLFNGGLTGSAVADLSDEVRGRSLSGITYSPERVTGRLLKPELLDIDEIIIKPGSTLEKNIKVAKGLSSKARELTISFTAFGEEVYEQNVTVGETVYGGAVDVDNEENLIDLYFVVPPTETDEEYLFEISIEEDVGGNEPSAGDGSLPSKFSISRPFISLFKGRTSLFAEVMGPYRINSQEASIFAQQLIYDENLYQGDYKISTKLIKGSTIVAEQSYPVRLE